MARPGIRPITPAEVRKYFDDVRVGLHGRARSRADELATKCSMSAIARVHTPAVVLLHGQMLVESEELTRAAAYLQQGLAMLADTGPHPMVGDGDHHRALLASIALQLGSYDIAAAHLETMEEPHRSLDTRFAALRTRAQLATIGANPEAAHQFLNTAASLAERLKGSFATALIEGDRVNLLASQGRLMEAMVLADHLMLRTMRPVRGDHGAWAASITASICFTLSRHSVDQGRGFDAERFLVAGIAAVERAPSAYLTAHMQLAMARAWRLRRNFEPAEAALQRAASEFGRLGCLPALALVSLEDACLAEARQLSTSTRALFERALQEFEAVGHAWEIGILRRHLGLVDDHAQVMAATSAGPSPFDMRAGRRDRLLG